MHRIPAHHILRRHRMAARRGRERHREADRPLQVGVRIALAARQQRARGCRAPVRRDRRAGREIRGRDGARRARLPALLRHYDGWPVRLHRAPALPERVAVDHGAAPVGAGHRVRDATGPGASRVRGWRVRERGRVPAWRATAYTTPSGPAAAALSVVQPSAATRGDATACPPVTPRTTGACPHAEMPPFPAHRADRAHHLARGPCPATVTARYT